MVEDLFEIPLLDYACHGTREQSRPGGRVPRARAASDADGWLFRLLFSNYEENTRNAASKKIRLKI